MRVEELIIDGFKSYATRTVISDWDPQFNAITGLNGSGKSNILDAICFVLGISSMSTVRASNIQDLIYKRGQAGVTKASVTIVFDNSDKSKSPIGFTESHKISVTRQIVLGGTSKYLINGHRAPQQSVLQLFQSVQLNINNPNFLIMQGKITKVLNMKPKEILSLIEEAAGTKMFEDRKEKAERTMARKEVKLQENTTLLQEEIQPKLDKLKTEKRAFLDFQTIQTDLEKITKVVAAYNYKFFKDTSDKNSDNISIYSEKKKRLEDDIHVAMKRLESLKEEVEKIKRQKKEELEKDGTLSKYEKAETDLINGISRIKASEAIVSQNVREVNNTLKRLQLNHTKLIKDIDDKLKKFEEINSSYHAATNNMEHLKKIHKNKSELLSTLSTGITSTGEAEQGYSAQLHHAQEEYNELKITIQTLEKKIQGLSKNLSSNDPKLIQAQKDNEKDLIKMKSHETKCNKIKKELDNLGFNPNNIKNMKQREVKLKQDLQILYKSTEYLKRKVSNLEFQYTSPSANFDPSSVKGVAAKLFTLKEHNFDSATALQVCAGGRLYNIVVDNEKTASQLLEHGRLKKRVTIIPLNKIASKRLNSEVLKFAKELAPGKVELALDLIGYEEEVTKAMEYIFGTSLICKDADTAKKVTFNPKVRTKSITLSGDIYDPAGTLSGGSKSNSSSLLLDIQEYNKSTRNIRRLEDELNETLYQIKQEEQLSRNTKVLQTELEMELHRLKLVRNSLETNSSAQLIKENEQLKAEIKECIKNKSDAEIQMYTLENEIQKIQKDAKEFANDKSAKLKELEDEILQTKEQLLNEEQAYEILAENYQTLEFQLEQLKSDEKQTKEDIEENKQSLGKLGREKDVLIQQLNEQQEKLADVQNKLNNERDKLLSIDEKLKEMELEIKKTHDYKVQCELDFQKNDHNLSKLKGMNANVREKLETLLKDNDWLKDESQVNYIIEQHKGINVDEYREREHQLQEMFDEMKRKVNPNIMAMIENVEKKEISLKTMIKTIEKDKIKIQETITKLNEYKKEALVTTWKKVDKDFGNIFSDLLPNSFAKLVLCEGKEISEGLEIKVKLGNIWKESLVELSGGQRSLIALSLIMALLQFRPAPMYILDEVDAALDLSHTQNIGHLIKTRFKGSQFIIVSLKEGMFSNANRVFRTRFQNGTSVVGVM
ncbi:condensin subunit SMC2 PWA37_005328 [Arxiozyma heterogenica]|uniref:Structural maintenance of chromosomes protein n=1 Tax=Arxiozyma heterogenica TaxID=278026 RepID=A0AAN7ZTG9_9SACH|nr:hypothetical protein RI543_000259 [Kazachstania heterogenica]